ncbi:MAG: ComF family protein [Patescibacteria group bacterium]
MNLLDFIFPRHCLSCLRFGKYFCNICVSTIRTIGVNEAICPICGRRAFGGMTHPRCKTKYSLDGLTSIFHYDGIIKQAIKSLKYRRITDLAQEFVNLVPGSCHPGEGRDPVLIPISLHSSRFRDRGFNQAEVLGRLLADRLPAGKAGLHIPMRTDILKRVIATTPQVEMKDRKERLKNMKNVFFIHHSSFIIRNSVILFDDVFTTGATMRAAGETLKRAGAKRVWAVTMAR